MSNELPRPFRLRRFVIIPAMLVALGVCSVAQAQENTILSVGVRGNVKTTPEEILAQVHTRQGDALASRSTIQRIRRDMHRIVALGFFDDVMTAFVPTREGTELYYVVQERASIRDIVIEGAQQIRPNRLRNDIGWDASRRNFFSQRDVTDYVLAVERAYQAQGFPATQVTSFVDEVSPNEVVVRIRVIEGRQWRIERVEIEGNDAFRDKELQRQMRTKARSFWFFRTKYDEGKFLADLNAVRRHYGNAGYLDSDVTRGEFEETEKGLVLRVKVDEGPQYTALPLEVRGNTIFTDTEIGDVVATASGAIFSEGEYLLEDRRRVVELYEAQGYLESSVRTDIVELDPEQAVARPVIDIQEGNRIYLGNVIVRGVYDTGEIIDGNPVYEDLDLKTKRYVIRREIDLKRGDVFDWTKVKDADRNLGRLGYFKRVDFTDPRYGQARARGLYLDPGFAPPIPTDDPDVYDLMLEVEEVRAGSVGFGGGFSTAVGPSVFVSLEEPNLYGRGQRFTSSVMFGSRVTSYNIGLEEPHFLQSEFSLGLNAYRLERQSYGGRAFDEKRLGGNVRLGRTLWPDTRIYVDLGYESIDIDLLSRGRFVFSDGPDVIPRDRTNTARIATGIVHDTRDNFERPTMGHLYRAEVEFAGLVGDNEFARVEMDATWYRTLGWQFVASYHTNVGMLFGFGDTDPVPIYERYFMGGGMSIRGYEEDSIGPHGLLRQDSIEGPVYGRQRNDKFFVGGETRWVNNLQMHYPINEMLEGLVFLDWGLLGYDSMDFDPGEIRAGAGVGLRIKLPIGATAGLDFGIPLNAMDEDQKRTVHFRFAQSFR